MKILILAACVAVSAAFIPGERPACNADNVEGGSILLAHENYCQLFYACNGDQQSFPMTCPDGFLFTYADGLANCLLPSDEQVTCINWRCTQLDVGNRFPDTCCSKYWQCVSPGQYEQRTCPNGQRFNALTENCDFNQNSCTDDSHCIDNITPSTNNRCHDFANDDGNPCLYKTVFAGVTTPDRPCASNTAFDPITCACTQTNPTCFAGAISPEQMAENKRFDSQCRASRRLEFNGLPLRTFSDKINVELRHFFLNPGMSLSNNEAVFVNGNSGSYIYDYFFNDNILRTPFAISLLFRVDTTPNIGDSITLLSNEFTLDPNNPLCDPPTVNWVVRYDGISNGLRTWTVTISATGINGATATSTGVTTGDAQDYYQINFQFSGTFSATLINRGQNGISTLRSSQINSNINLGASLRPNKCGFVIGRGLNGRIRRFNVYEGCGNFNVI